jgi:hypothetical protein
MQQLFFSRHPVFSSARWPMKILERIQYFHRWGKPTKLTTLFSSVVETDETNCIFSVGQRSRRKYCVYFRRLRWPTKRYIFSSVADENAFIFIDFILSAYFRRPTDEYIYFRRLFGYFLWFLADEIKLFSCSGMYICIYRQHIQAIIVQDLKNLERKTSNYLKCMRLKFQ